MAEARAEAAENKEELKDIAVIEKIKREAFGLGNAGEKSPKKTGKSKAGGITKKASSKKKTTITKAKTRTETTKKASLKATTAEKTKVVAVKKKATEKPTTAAATIAEGADTREQLSFENKLFEPTPVDSTATGSDTSDATDLSASIIAEATTEPSSETIDNSPFMEEQRDFASEHNADSEIVPKEESTDAIVATDVDDNVSQDSESSESYEQEQFAEEDADHEGEPSRELEFNSLGSTIPKNDHRKFDEDDLFDQDTSSLQSVSGNLFEPS